MTKRIFRSLCFLSTLILILGFIFTTIVTYRQTTLERKNQFHNYAYYIQELIEQQGIKALNSDTAIVKENTKIVCRNGSTDELLYTFDPSFPEDASTYTFETRLTDGTTLQITTVLPSMRDVLQELLPSYIIVLWIFLVITLSVSYGLAKFIVKPIKEIDLKSPKPELVYPELKPLVQKLANQNQTIRTQMVDLFEQQQKFDTFTENMSEGMLIVDREGKLVSYNGAASGILSISLDHKGKEVSHLSPSPAFLAVMNDALEGKHAQQLIPMFDRTYQVIGNPIKVKEELMGAVLALLDVTEREERDRLRQEFSANVSHELKTPLTSISGFAEIMMNGLAKPQDMRHFASRIYDEAQRLILLIGDIIQLSRLEEKDLSAQIEQVDLYEIASEIYTRLQHDAKQKKIDFRLQGSSCFVQGIPHILDEMIYNLCDNAIKYNREKGSVTLTVIPREQDIMVAVADTGIGIPFEEQERVFERFYRIDKSHSKEIGGTGLGLSIVKHGAVFHEATLQLESVPDEGTCITLLFPKCQ